MKTFKHYFYLVVYIALLTYEKIITLSTQIEYNLTSRPLVSQSEDPSVFSITPGRFLIRDSLRCYVKPNYYAYNYSEASSNILGKGGTWTICINYNIARN